MESVVIKTRIRPDKIEEAREWFSELIDRKDEVLASMKAEGVHIESAFLDSQEDNHFVIYYMRAENVQKAYDIFGSSFLPIDLWYGKRWRELFDGRQELPVLLDLRQNS